MTGIKKNSEFQFYLVLWIFIAVACHSSNAHAIATGSQSMNVINSSGGGNAGGSSIVADEFSGAATYSLKLAIPPWRNGIEPQILLNYNSHRKNPNSWVGYGWDLNLGQIERTSSGYSIDYYSGTEFKIRFAGLTEDLKLVETNINVSAKYGITSTGSYRVDEYAAKTESGFNIYLHVIDPSNADNALDQGWIVIDKSGTYFYFGQSEQSRSQMMKCDVGQEEPCTKKQWIEKWVLEKIEDSNGNFVDIVSHDSSFYPHEIQYGDVIIRFSGTAYSGAYFPVYRQGFYSPTDEMFQLDNVQVYHNSDLIQQYTFSYEEDDVTRIRYLVSVVQGTGDTNGDGVDEEMLEPVVFDYYDQSSMEWSTTSYDMSASSSSINGSNSGFINYDMQFADMNGDGLMDKVVAYADANTMDVFYNTGKDFSFINGKSSWSDPVSPSGCSACIGELNVYEQIYEGEQIFNMTLKNHQVAFLMDMNGDALPDRVAAIESGSGNNQQKDLGIVFNTGQGWGSSAIWRDPYIGSYPGSSDADKSFIDMNGDGLVDRIVGDTATGSYKIYLNTGAGFKLEPEIWKDPVAVIEPSHPGISKMYSDDGTGVWSAIKDFNGDGLPDRIYRTDIYNYDGVSEQSTYLGKGIAISLNQNGRGWAIPQQQGDYYVFDGLGVLSVLDPVEDDSAKGYLAPITNNTKHDWIDMNGDGILDRVIGDPATGKFKVYFYRGIKPGGAMSEGLSDAVEFDDPVAGLTNDWPESSGYVSAVGSNNIDVHTFIKDMDGDGYPDRVTVQSKGSGGYEYKFYPMRVNAIEFSDSFTSNWNDPFINQPVGLLKSISKGSEKVTALEYLPSSRPTKWSMNFVGYPIHHKFLPLHLNLLHKVYNSDYTFTDSGSVTEAIRNPGMRWTSYSYFGGNFYVRPAVKLDPADYSSDALSEDYYKQFNGFHSVTREIYKSSSESWSDYANTTIYHQIWGDVTATPSDDYTYYDLNALKHIALSGKPYIKSVESEDGYKFEENYEYNVSNTTMGDDFNCGTPCFVELLSLESSHVETGSTAERTKKIEYKHDTSGNIIEQKSYAKNQLILTEQFEYYSASDFDLEFQIRNKKKLHEKIDGATSTSIAKSEYTYDSQANLLEEKIYTDISTGSYQTIQRIFDVHGNVIRLTEVDDVAKTYAYDSESLFPVTESITLPTGDVITRTKSFDRLTGTAMLDLNEFDVGVRSTLDGFGRTTMKTQIDADGAEEIIQNISYSETHQNFGSLTDAYILETRNYNRRPSDLTLPTEPTSVTFTDRNGFVLQECTYSERGNYRVLQTHPSEGGRIIHRTEPFFASACEFLPTLSASVAHSVQVLDLQGRILSITNPPGETDSPNPSTAYGYANTTMGLFETIISVDGQTQKIETRNALDQLLEVVDADGTEVSYSLDGLGQILSVTVDGKVLTQTTYDGMGRKISMTDLDLGTWQYGYHSNGKLFRQTDANGNVVLQNYDSAARLSNKKSYDSTGAVTKEYIYTYDAGSADYSIHPGELYEVQELNGTGSLLRSTRYSYDLKKHQRDKITRTIPDLGDVTQKIRYDLLGQIDSITNPGSTTLYYKRDHLGRLQTICSTSNCDASSGENYYSIDPSTGYDEFGQLLQETYGNSVHNSYEYYTQSHRLKSFRVERDADVYSQKQYTYDSLSNIKSYLDPLDKKGSASYSNIQYDNLNRLTSFHDESTTLTQTFTFSSDGNVQTHSANFGAENYIYDSSRPHAVTKIGAREFEYDNNGNLIGDGERVLTYNSENQLANVTLSNGMIVQYEYDFSGQRVFKKVTRSDSLSHVVESETHYVDDNLEIKGDQLIFHLYAGGKKIATKSLGTVSDIFGGAGASLRNIGIDPEFGFYQLSSLLMLAFVVFVLASFRPVPSKQPVWAFRYLVKVYGPRSFSHELVRVYLSLLSFWRSYRRAFQEAVFTFHHDFAVKCLSLILIFSFAFLMPARSAFAGDVGKVPGQISDANYFYYVHGDHLNSAHIMTEGQSAGGKHSGILYQRGDLLQRIEYTPFGQEKFVLNPNLRIDPAYTNQVYDVETGLYYFKTRYYDTKLSRFIQPDTMVPDMTDTQQFNRYSYVKNNPLKYVDPSGHFNIFSAIGQGIGLFFQSMQYGGAPTSGYNMASLETDIDYSVFKMNVTSVTDMITNDVISKLDEADESLRSISKYLRGKGVYVIPPELHVPDGVNINDNIDLAKDLYAIEFYFKVRSDGDWDYKGKDLKMYENFGNYHFGMVGMANGWLESDLKIGAGLYQIWRETSSFEFYDSYFDDPKDMYWIERGIQDYKDFFMNR